jgi:hypothetical protein
MEQSLFWEANSSSASQEIPRTLWNTTVHYRIHKSALHVPTLRQIDPVHATPPPPDYTYLISILILSLRLNLGLSSGFFP